MIKIRADVVLVAMVVFLLVSVGNFFYPVEKVEYKKADPSSFEIGLPADESVKVVSTVKELEKAQKKKGHFALKVDKDKLIKTDYYYSAKRRQYPPFQKNSFVMYLRYAFTDDTYDRLYVAELEDGNRILVRIFERALDLSGDSIVLPIGKKVTYADSTKAFEDVNDEYELTTEDATKWCVDASGYWFRQEYLLKKVSASERNWGIVVGVMVVYMILSSVITLVRNKRQTA